MMLEVIAASADCGPASEGGIHCFGEFPTCSAISGLVLPFWLLFFFCLNQLVPFHNLGKSLGMGLQDNGHNIIKLNFQAK